MSEELPKGWVRTTLGEVAEVHDGRRIPLNRSERAKRPGPYPYFGANGQVDTIDDYLFDGRHVLLAEDGGYFDDPFRPNAYEADGKFWVNNHAHILQARPAVEHGYLLHALNATDLMPFVSGTTRLKLTQADMRRIPLALPPLAEQRRIVARIEALFARTRHARADLLRIAPLVERSSTAVLASAFRGDLTADLRASDESSIDEGLWSVPESWSWRRVDEVARVGLGRQRSPANHTGPCMRPYVRAANITWDGWDLTDVKEMNFAEPDFSRFKLMAGDVLLNEGSGSAREVGKPAIWRGEITDCCFQNTLLRVQPHECTAEYFYYYFLEAALSGRFADETQGVNIHHIGKEGLAAFPIPVPPHDEQVAIAQRLKDALARSDQAQRDASRALSLLDHLERSILARAFRGELVPQDPADEPASVMLARMDEPGDARARRGRRARVPA